MLTIIGVDPGVTTGIAVLEYSEIINSQGPGAIPPGTLSLIDEPLLYQTTPRGAVRWLDTQLALYGYARERGEQRTVVFAVEHFIEGRHSNTAAGRRTRELVDILTAMIKAHRVQVHTNTAAQVKPWATDKRLAAVPVPFAPGMRHALDAARHALFVATSHFDIPDPLSRKAGS
jgi:hypothetical protein